jgi:hypothetical protein
MAVKIITQQMKFSLATSNADGSKLGKKILNYPQMPATNSSLILFSISTSNLMPLFEMIF